MKHTLYFSTLFATMTLFSSCSESTVTDDFENANGTVTKKYIESIQYLNDEDQNPIEMTYNEDGSLKQVSDGTETTTLIYEDQSLVESDGVLPISVTSVVAAPIDFENANVLEYDDNGNPIVLEILESYEDYVDGEEVIVETVVTATISYDDKPNFFFATLEAAGIVEMLDALDISFSPSLQATPEIVKARELMPMNNIVRVEFDFDGSATQSAEINVTYEYDADGYPSKATLVLRDEYEGEINEVTEAISISYK